MIVVIIAGGSGTRLWPLSTPDYPKHLLALTGERTLVQMTLDRVSDLTDMGHVLIVPEVSHAEHIRTQLPDLPQENILVEPARRGTGNCLLFALRAIKKRDWPADEPIAVFWADHIINDKAGFTKTIKHAAALSRREHKIVDIGIHPTYPSTGFHYFKRGEALKGVGNAYALERFQGKPDAETAKRYIAEGGYYWNTGYIVASLEVYERNLEKYAPDLWSNYNRLLEAPSVDETYLTLEDANLEASLSEKDPDLLMTASDFDWIDIGSHNDLHNTSQQDIDGNVVVGNKIELEQVRHAMVRNETELPVAVIGVEDIVVMVTKDGVLVANKSDSQKVGEVSKRFKSD